MHECGVTWYELVILRTINYGEFFPEGISQSDKKYPIPFAFEGQKYVPSHRLDEA